MARKPKHKSNGMKPSQTGQAQQTQTNIITTSAVQADPDLGYRMRVLLYDLRNVIQQPSSAIRLDSTIDEHYISIPYFSPEQATIVKGAVVDTEINTKAEAEMDDEQVDPDEAIDRPQTPTPVLALTGLSVDSVSAGATACPATTLTARMVSGPRFGNWMEILSMHIMLSNHELYISQYDAVDTFTAVFGSILPRGSVSLSCQG